MSSETQRARQLILYAVGVGLALAVAWRLRSVLLLLYVSVVFAVVLSPLVTRITALRLRGWSPSRIQAIFLLVGLTLGGFVLLFSLAVPPVVRDVQHFGHELPSRIPEFAQKVRGLPVIRQFDTDSLVSRAETGLNAVGAYLLNATPMFLSHLLDVATALILCLYFMTEGSSAYQWFLSFFSGPTRKRLDRTLKTAEQRMSGWLLGQGALMLILGLTSTAVFGMLHVRYFVLLGFLMGLFNLIPVAGGVITISLAAIVAAVDSWPKMLGVLIFYAIYIWIENGILIPRIMRSSVNLPGLAVLVSLLIGSELAGVVGALVAIPTAALVAVLLDEYLVQTPNEEAA